MLDYFRNEPLFFPLWLPFLDGHVSRADFNFLILQNIDAQSSDASQMIPQHNYKLDVNALNTRHPGEVCCLR